ncbi:GNAT family N-acetyltransferase [Halomonas sp. THAF12]|uniref:GNAT family N-acetyltransferase n=1 Tax=Halomonas sp. B23F22_10 TaxID=3459515 RepID=UPI00373FAA72
MNQKTHDLRPLERQQLATLRDWFPDADSCRRWGGPAFRYPFTAQGFREDLGFDELASFGLLGDAGELLGVGQYAERWGRCHLMRLAVAPHARGRGLGGELIRRLASRGGEALGVETCSLWVFPDNPARRLYRRLGFAEAQAAVPQPPLCYMVARLAELRRGLTPSRDGPSAWRAGH